MEVLAGVTCGLHRGATKAGPLAPHPASSAARTKAGLCSRRHMRNKERL